MSIIKPKLVLEFFFKCTSTASSNTKFMYSSNPLEKKNKTLTKFNQFKMNI